MIRWTLKEILIEGEEFKLPCIQFTPSKSKGAAVIVHGYGGSKEEQLGLAWRVALKGITTCAIDIRGHGENPNSLDGNILTDLEVAISYCRQFGKVVAIGHSLGGRLALVSSADYAVGISPALGSIYSSETQNALKWKRDYRVKADSPDLIFDVFSGLPIWQPEDDRKIIDHTLIVYGSRDMPDIMASCRELESDGLSVIQIDGALHNDIYNIEATFEVVTGKIGEWFD